MNLSTGIRNENSRANPIAFRINTSITFINVIIMTNPASCRLIVFIVVRAKKKKKKKKKA
jgi:hypothetical protein